MSEQKPRQFRPPLYHDSAKNERRQAGAKAGDEQRGWEAYRKWLSRVSAKTTAERTPIDHSLYSWHGYHSWADKVRQTWKSDDKSS